MLSTQNFKNVKHTKLTKILLKYQRKFNTHANEPLMDESLITLNGWNLSCKKNEKHFKN